MAKERFNHSHATLLCCPIWSETFGPQKLWIKHWSLAPHRMSWVVMHYDRCCHRLYVQLSTISVIVTHGDCSVKIGYLSTGCFVCSLDGKFERWVKMIQESEVIIEFPVLIAPVLMMMQYRPRVRVTKWNRTNNMKELTGVLILAFYAKLCFMSVIWRDRIQSESDLLRLMLTQ